MITQLWIYIKHITSVDECYLFMMVLKILQCFELNLLGNKKDFNNFRLFVSYIMIFFPKKYLRVFRFVWISIIS